MTSSNGKKNPRYWPLHRWIPLTKASNAELLSAWINGWVNNREAGGLRRHHAHYDVTVMECRARHDIFRCFFRWANIYLKWSRRSREFTRSLFRLTVVVNIFVSDEQLFSFYVSCLHPLCVFSWFSDVVANVPVLSNMSYYVNSYNIFSVCIQYLSIYLITVVIITS